MRCFGSVPRGFDATIRRGIRGHPIGLRDRLRKNRISCKRRLVERMFAVMKRVLNGCRVLMTSLSRVQVKLLFSCFCFNLVQLRSPGARP